MPESSQEVKVFRKIRTLKPGSDLAESGICEGDSAGKEVFDNGSFTFGKDVRAHSITNLGKGLYALSSYASNGNYAPEKGAKKLSVTELKTVAGEQRTQQDIKGKLVEFAFWMQKQGYKESTIETRIVRLKTLVERGANLLDPESIKNTIALQKT